MSNKMVDTRFTIQFTRTDPSHLQVAEILNRQGRRSKAQYIVNAVLHYENCNETPNVQRVPELDKVIEAVVYRILREREESGAEKTVKPAPESQVKKSLHFAEEIGFDDALEVLGSDGLNAVTGAMEMFRKK